MLEIKPVELHWMEGGDEASDLCCHGGVRLSVDGSVILDTGSEDYAVSTGALHLLRTLTRDHTKAKRLAEHLIPHCGHFMVVDEDSGAVVNLGCAVGVNWWVEHIEDHVILGLESGEYRLPRSEWDQAVRSFALDVMAFYDAGGEKSPSDDLSQEWYPVFRGELASRMEGGTPTGGRDGT